MAEPKTAVAQVRAAARLAVQATGDVTRVVERMHHSIGGGPALLGKPLAGLTKLLTAPTYGAIRGVTGAVGAGLDLALSALEPLLVQPGLDGGAALAALNGVVGDFLAATDSPLALEMRLCSRGVPLELTPTSLAAAFPAGGRLLVLVHGSSMEDSQWLRDGHDHGLALAADRDLVPVYLRYNSGLHVSENGRKLAALLEQLVAAWPHPVEGLWILAHSMGGLVARSACLAAEAGGQAWRAQLRALVTLGSPHHGAPLERGGNWVQFLLGLSRHSAPLALLGHVRSAGVTDLRYGNVLDEHWSGQDRFAKHADPRTTLSLPVGVDCFAIAATTATSAATLTGRLPGDGLVPVDSALGRHENPALALDFGEERRWIALGARHLDLLSSPAVYAKLLTWL